MSQQAKSAPTILFESPRDYFESRVEAALRRLKFSPRPASRIYLIALLQHFMFSQNLFPIDDETGKVRRQTLAELYLRAQNAPAPERADLLKKLGDSSLYISGFFGDSLNRKVVDLDYYVGMGGTAYSALAHAAHDGPVAEMYGEFSSRFAIFVDVLTYISQETAVQSNGDLLRLYDRYLTTGSRLAEEQLLEKGLLTADTTKTKAHKV